MGQRRVMVVTAAMGGGHLQVAEELARRLHLAGESAVTVDLNTVMAAGSGRALQRLYPWLVDHAPWLYDRIFRVFFDAGQTRGERVTVTTLLAQPGLRRALAGYRPDVVVATYHLAGLALGRLRQRGELDVPAVTFVTTFGLHDLWLHPGTDLYLCITEATAAAVRRRTGRPAVNVGPVVRSGFGCPDGRDARARLGIPADARVAVIVAGSLGIGPVEPATDVVRRLPGWVPVVACGRNAALRERLARRDGVVVLGWVDDMAGLMAAGDVLIDNAGGLSSKEALAAGLPVVTFRPIAGHGRADARAMAAVGVTDVVDDEAELAARLRALAEASPARTARIARGLALFGPDPLDPILRLAGGAVPEPAAGEGAA